MSGAVQRRWRAGLVSAALAAVLPLHAAPDVPVDPTLGESIVMVKNARLLPVDLETTLFRPPGNGPFPVVVINHGKESGNNRMQPRSRPTPAVREFLQRGYAVVVPMRQGFSNSGGRAVGEGCNIAGNGDAQADDIRAVVTWLATQPWADTQRMVMLGQSHGGLATLAYARDPNPGFKLFVNFAGGLKWADGGCQWERALVDAYARYGAGTKVASLWFYGANDSYFPPDVIRPAHAAYVAAGGPAEMVAFGAFGNDAHSLFASARGLPIWWPTVELKLAAAGLPSGVAEPQFAPPVPMAAPPASGFAAVDDVDKLPRLSEKGREVYRQFLTKPAPRAFALSDGGAWGWATEGYDPLRRAMEICRRTAAAECRLYAVDAAVVWSEK